jgi:mono/diheme cytochrome c family protein
VQIMALCQVLKKLPFALLVAAVGCTEAEKATEDKPQSEVTDTDPPIAGVGGSGDRMTPIAGSSTVSMKPPIATPPAICSPVTPTVGPGFASGGTMPHTLFGPSVQRENAPPPITGGTMLTTADGNTLVAADPERDQLYFVDPLNMQPLHTVALTAGDQPGRVIEDAAGRIHVVLRGASAVATLTREEGSEVTRREVCAVPRGIAYDATHDQVHVVCAEGKLVSLGADPALTAPARTLDLRTDLRDVIVRDNRLFVTRFRAAELLILDADGVLQETRTPTTFGHDETRTVVEGNENGACSQSFTTETVRVESTPNVAWRTIDVPSKGVTMLHQRSRTDEIQVTAGGYGAGSCGSGIVQTALTTGLDGAVSATGDLGDATLAVDVATDSAGELLAVVAPGNHGSFLQVMVLQVSALQPTGTGAGGGVGVNPSVPSNADAAATGGSFAAPPGTSASPGSVGTAPCMGPSMSFDTKGQATSVTFVSPYVLAVQEREPAGISFYDLRTSGLRQRIEVSTDSSFDTGHTLFHARAGAGVACASCHPEAGDDGHTWRFATIGPRRTQTLRGGLLGTEPLHWNGDMADFDMLVSEVFVGRMSGFSPSPDQADALANWLDRQPSLHAAPADAAAAERGKVLFESEEVRCSQCHAGSHLTNNKTENVGTGADLQVPSLKGVRFRAPLMHDGCAADLSERFSKVNCGGGDKHGTTSQLDAAQIGDLTAYLETL